MQSLAIDTDTLKAAMAAGVRLLPQTVYEGVRSDAQVALELIDVCAEAVAADEALYRRAFGDHPLARLLVKNIRCGREPVGRFDIMVDDQGRNRFIEYNAGACGGAFTPLRAAERFVDSGQGRELAASVRLDLAPTDELYVRSLRDGRPGPALAGTQHLAIILPTGMTPPGPILDELQCLSAIYEAQDGEVRILPFSAIEVGEDGLWADGWPIHTALIFEWMALVSEGPPGHPLFSNDMVGQTWVAHSLPTAAFRGGKHLFAVMSDPALGAPLTPAQRRWVDEHIPVTRILPMADVAEPWAEDALAWAVARREHLVLKPALGLGGRGVVAGWTLDDEAWRALLDKARATPHILQERVTPRREPELPEGAISDLSPFIWFDRSIQGMQSRASGTWLLNMIGGGWPYPVVAWS